MVRSFFCFWALAIAVVAREPLSAETLRRDIVRHIAQARFTAGMWGIKVQSLDSGKILFETNSLKLLKPASNAKIFTGALALDSFGPDYCIRTSLLALHRPNPNGALAGDLIVYGRGDPSFSARFNQGSYSNLLAPVVNAIKRAGITSIGGDLIGDETYFRGPRIGSGWTADDLVYYYGAEVSALSLQDNVVDLLFRPSRTGDPAHLELKPATDFLQFVERPLTGTNRTSISILRDLASRQVRITGNLAITHSNYTDAVTVPNPALWFVTMLREQLAREGIPVRGTLRTWSWPMDAPTDISSLRELGSVESRPMRQLVENMLKPSQNLYAQLLLLHAGAKLGGVRLTEEQGIRSMGILLQGLGIDRREVLLEEGSGLSRAALVTPNAITALLEGMARHKHAGVFFEALPEPGEGTLRRRLPELKGRLRAKTGSLRFVNTLSGYLTSSAGERLVFAIMLNAYEPTAADSSPRDEIDYIVRLLARLSEKI